MKWPSHKMADQARTRQKLDWETPTHSNRRSVLSKFLPASKSNTNRSILPFKNSSGTAASTAPPKSTDGPTADSSAFQIAQSTPTGRFSAFRTSLQGHFDHVLPPHKRYLGRTRRFFLVFILLPIFLLIILVLGLGLGFGLRHKSSKNLPLPGSGVQTVELTYYTPAQGACGWTNDESDLVVAVAHKLFDSAGEGGSNPNDNPLCGRKIRVQRDFVESGAGRQSVDVEVVDRCTGCEPTDLDLSPAAFKKLALESQGRVQGEWAWL